MALADLACYLGGHIKNIKTRSGLALVDTSEVRITDDDND